jgi:hypothetical protein
MTSLTIESTTTANNATESESFLEFLNVKQKNAMYFNGIKLIVSSITPHPEGNCVWYHGTTNEAQELLTKQYNLFLLGKSANNVLEIGFNAGHSTLLFLMSNPTSKVTVFDICYHKYTDICFDYLSTVFPGRLTLIKGNSLETVPEFLSKNLELAKKFDLFHIDGYHEYEHVRQEILNVKKIADVSETKSDKIVILDDDNFPDLYRLHRELIDEKVISLFGSDSNSTDAKILPTEMYTHMIVKFTSL